MDRKIVEYLLQGEGIRWICRQLGIGDRRVRRVRELADMAGYLSGTVPLPPYPEALFPDPDDARADRSSEPDQALLARKDWIADRLQTGWRPITVLEELGFSISRSSFYRFLHRHDLYKVGRHFRRVVPEIVHEPGEALLLDWGKLRDVIDPETGKRRALWAFVGILGFSRYMMVRLVWSNELQTTLDAIESMFRELGGVVLRLTSDNAKCFALTASKYEPLLNPVFERFAGHYGAIIECLPPREPKKKGKVERPMPYVRRLYEAHGQEWHGLEESQRYLDRKVALANERRHGTTGRRPIDDLTNVELGHLKALPALAFEREEFGEADVRRDGHVRFQNKYYSLDEKYIGEQVTLLGNQKQVLIYHQGKLIEIHERLWDPYRSKQTKKHHLKPWEQTLKDDSFYRRKALSIGPDVERMIVILLKQGQGFVDTRKIWGILSLDKTHGTDAINQACREAIDMGSYSYRTVRTLVELQVSKKPDEAPPAPRQEHRFTRPLTVYQEQLELTLKN